MPRNPSFLHPSILLAKLCQPWMSCLTISTLLPLLSHRVPFTNIPHSLKSQACTSEDKASQNQLNGKWPCRCSKDKKNSACQFCRDSPYNSSVSDFSALKKTVKGNCKAPLRTHCPFPPPANKLGMGEFSISLQLSTATWIAHLFPLTEKDISTTAWL